MAYYLWNPKPNTTQDLGDVSNYFNSNASRANLGLATVLPQAGDTVWITGTGMGTNGSLITGTLAADVSGGGVIVGSSGVFTGYISDATITSGKFTGGGKTMDITGGTFYGIWNLLGSISGGTFYGPVHFDDADLTVSGGCTFYDTLDMTAGGDSWLAIGNETRIYGRLITPFMTLYGYSPLAGSVLSAPVTRQYQFPAK